MEWSESCSSRAICPMGHDSVSDSDQILLGDRGCTHSGSFWVWVRFWFLGFDLNLGFGNGSDLRRALALPPSKISIKGEVLLSEVTILQRRCTPIGDMSE